MGASSLPSTLSNNLNFLGRKVSDCSGSGMGALRQEVWNENNPELELSCAQQTICYSADCYVISLRYSWYFFSWAI